MRIPVLLSCLLAPLAGTALLAAPVFSADDDDATPCEKTAAALRNAGELAARDDFWTGVAVCLNITRRSEAVACLRDDMRALQEALDLVADQLDARLDLCDQLGGGRYDPDIDPDDFVTGVSHPFFPLVPGHAKVYRTETDEGTETDEVTVTHDTKTILDVECIVVHDVVTLEGELVEDTLDYFAQDEDGNVWYFGELSMSFEDGELVDLAGSWTAGVDGARPGIVMLAHPDVGDVYRQEFLPAVAEDAALVTHLGRTVSVPAGSFSGCLETLDFTPLEPGQSEAKSYAPGVGVVLEVNLETGERTELVGIF